jgi:hypothetical protein
MRLCNALRLALCACGLVITAVPAAAQGAPAAAPGTVAAVAAAPAPAEPAAGRRVPEPNVQRIVSEDDNVRIDELRVRGQTKEIVVHHKAVAGSRYEILPGEGGRDPSTQDKRSGGQSVWRLFSF